jgi:ZIP family zinc transporter
VEELIIPFSLALLAGLSTGIGSIIAFFMKEFKIKYLSYLLGFSAGVMITVSFVELLATAIASVGFLLANMAFFVGILIMFVIDQLVPHDYMWEKCEIKDKKLMKTGILTTIGIAIHNFPEGIVVLLASMNSIELGILLAIAIALHNIPEGIAVFAPIYYATKDKKVAFKYSFLSGLAEPVGALVGGLILLPFVNQMLLNSLLAFAAGIMVFISLDELIPTAYEYMYESELHTGHLIISGIVTGMLVMTLSLWLLR